jgi:serine/threonine protein kinase
MFSVEDDSIFSDFEEQELVDPSPRKLVDGRIIYLSRKLRMPKTWGAPFLCDFGSAVTGDIEHTEDVQPDIYRATEVILEAPWSYEVDIWNTGCMVSTRDGYVAVGFEELIRVYPGLDMGSLRRWSPIYRT